ncbi:MAG: hypothetical protein K8R73_15235 [Clostridiales bacterium]|nr:hypothetical protein [Clostridiales bacterium]
MNKRQREMSLFDQSNQKYILGTLSNTGFNVEDLENIDGKSQYVCQIVESGLTGVIYKLKSNGFYNLKRKRKTSKVKNVDGQLSFLNELMCRSKILEHQEHLISLKNGIIKTIYADYRKGILLSEWIDGEHPEVLDVDWIQDTINITLDLQKIGLFEWDLSRGNILVKDNKVKLFDFGYCYQFDPLVDYNSEGVNEPRFHALERLETRYLMLELYKNQRIKGKAEMLQLYKEIKMAGIKSYLDHNKYLEANGASTQVLEHFHNIIEEWRKGISNIQELEKLYIKDVLRSHLLDIHDDLSGKSCTQNTLLRIMHLKELTDEYQWNIIAPLVDYNKKEKFLEDLHSFHEGALKYQHS